MTKENVLFFLGFCTFATANPLPSKIDVSFEQRGENTNPEEQRHNENEHKAESELNKTPMSDLFLLLSTEFSKVHVQCLIYQQVTIR